MPFMSSQVKWNTMVEPEQQHAAGQRRCVEVGARAEVPQHRERAAADTEDVDPEREVVWLKEPERLSPA
jgi:hypothetical protein